MTLSFQTQVKGYRILDLIDTGGFGEVYRAHQTAIDRDVAIKIILPEHANKPDFIRRFEAEAQLVAKLEHPHIAPLYDYWRDPDGAYLVMRYLRGGNLRDRIRQNCLDLKTAAQVVDQIASALYVAHRNNVIHRDIKPENILLDEDGNAYLTDFGIAKDLAGSKDYLTQPDSVMGSLDYLAPEQARGQPVTPSTDIYSLGVVMWEALVGQHPFEELSSVERLYKFINDPLPLIENLDPDRNAWINPVIQKATQKNPEHRYKDVIEFAEAFRKAAGLMVERIDLDLAEVLTAREQDVLRCLVQRKSNKEISEELVIELSTVKWYVAQIFKKLNVRSRVQAAARAKELNLVYDRKPSKFAATTGIYGLPELENPYKGLNAFTAADERDFFGREKLVLRLMERMSENSEYARFLSIVGPSGSGKSSLVKAGLIPALWRGGLPGSEKWFIVEMVPGTDAIDELEVALTKIVPQQGLNIGEYLHRDEKGLLTASKLILPEDDSELVLVVDQFEELFTLIEDEAERNRFLDLLHHAVMNKRSRIRVMVTMRADFYDRPLHYPAIAEMIRNRVETILPLSAEELERAIVNPARRVGLQLEEGLQARIINDVLYQPGGLPLMQYALTELYESRHDRLLTLSGYEAMGGVVGALANRAEQIYLEMDQATRLAAKQVFLRLVTLGDDGKNTRRRTALSELVEMFDDADMVEEIVDTYTAYRLLSMDHDPETRLPTVEVAHEAILVEWGRLREWLNESQMDIRIHRQLARATRDWQNAGMDDSYLLRGARLQQFEGWREETDLALTATEHQYLGKSITEREREQAEEAARQEHERTLEERAQKILRGLVAVMALAAVIAIGLSVFAFGQRNEALQNFSMSLAAHVQNALDNKENDLALALALAASEIDNPPPIVARMLRQAAYAPGPIAQIDIEETFGMDQMPFSMAVSPTEFVSLIGFHDGTLILWDVMEAKEIRRFEGHTDIIADVVFSPDGRKALSASYDTTAILWDVETGEILTRFEGHHGWLRAAAFSPDGIIVATGGFVGTEATDIKNPGELILWDPATGEEITRLDGHPSAVEALAFSPDGSKLLASSGMFASISNEASLYYWDLESEEIIYQLPLSFDAYDIAITPDGLTAVSASTDAVDIWDLETGKLVSTLSGYTGYPRSTVFTPYGDQLVTIDSNGKITLWDFKEATKSLDVLFHDHESGSWSDSQLAMARVALSPDGHYALSTADDNTFIIWNLRDAGEIRRISGHESLIGGIAITPDGKYILSGSGSMCFCGIPGNDNSVRFWDAATGEQIYLLEGHEDLVTMTHITPDGKTGISSSLDGSIRVWDLVSGIEKRVIEDAHHGGVFSVAISPDGKLALSGSVTETINPDTDGTILWNLETGERLAHYDYGVDNSTSVMFNPDGKSGYAGMNEFTYLDFETGEFTPIIPETRACCVGLDISSDGKTCFSANNEDTILRSWDIETGQIIQEFGIHGGSRTRVELSADDQVLLSSGLYGDLNLWEPQTGELLRTWNSSGVVHLDIDMSDDGKIAISPGPNNSVITWNLDLPLEISDVRAWIEQNRVVRDLTCEERLTYSIEPLCETE